MMKTIEELGEYITEKGKLPKPNNEKRADAATHALRNLQRLKTEAKLSGDESAKAELKTLFDRVFTDLIDQEPPNFEIWWAK